MMRVCLQTLAALVLLVELTVGTGCSGGCGPQYPAGSKFGLIDNLENAFRGGDEDAVAALLLDPSDVHAACPNLNAADREALRGELDRAREAWDSQTRICREEVDWNRTERVVLNYGSRANPMFDTCDAVERLESSELYYVSESDGYKVTLGGLVRIGENVRLTSPPRCSRKAKEKLAKGMILAGAGCADWPATTQTRGVVPGCP